MADGGDKPLTNDDFRKILFTPRPGSKPDLAQQAKVQQKQQTQKAKPRPKPKQQGGGGAGGRGGGGNNSAAGSDEDEGPSYRDRAAERRKGLGTGHTDDLDGGGGFLAATAADPDLSHLSYEETKYLGGDVDHTHLVKGLDFALLSKIRSEQTQQRGGGQGSVGEDAPQLPVSFAGPLGRAVYNNLFRSKNESVQEDVSERFLPRRTAFVFNIEEQGMNDVFKVPTTLLRAKEDCPAPFKVLEASSDAVLLDRLGKIMAYMAMGSGASGGSKQKLKKERKQELLIEAGFIQPILPAKKKAEKEEQQKQQIIKPAVDEEEDIFADAGTDYVVERRKNVDDVATEDVEEGEAKLSVDENKRMKYFGADAPTALEAGDLPPIAAAGAGNDAEDERKAKEREARHREMLASVGAVEDDGYAECYPSYYDAAGMVYDSEDDDGTGIVKPKALDAEDGEGEGEGGASKSIKDKGLAARKEAARQLNKERQKQDADLNKLQKVFEEKGYGNARAFGVKSTEGAAIAAGEEKGDGNAEAVAGAVPPLPTAKRRRI